MPHVRRAKPRIPGRPTRFPKPLRHCAPRAGRHRRMRRSSGASTNSASWTPRARAGDAPDGARIALVRGAPGDRQDRSWSRRFLRRPPAPDGGYAAAATRARPPSPTPWWTSSRVRGPPGEAHSWRTSSGCCRSRNPIVVGRLILAALIRSSVAGTGGGRGRRCALGRTWTRFERCCSRYAGWPGIPVLTILVVPPGRGPPAGRARAARRGAHRRHRRGRSAQADRAGAGRHRRRVAYPGIGGAPPVRPHPGQSPPPARAADGDPGRPLAGLGARAARPAGVQPDDRPPACGLQRPRAALRRGRRRGR